MFEKFFKRRYLKRQLIETLWGIDFEIAYLEKHCEKIKTNLQNTKNTLEDIKKKREQCAPAERDLRKQCDANLKQLSDVMDQDGEGLLATMKVLDTKKSNRVSVAMRLKSVNQFT